MTLWIPTIFAKIWKNSRAGTRFASCNSRIAISPHDKIKNGTCSKILSKSESLPANPGSFPFHPEDQYTSGTISKRFRQYPKSFIRTCPKSAFYSRFFWTRDWMGKKRVGRGAVPHINDGLETTPSSNPNFPKFLFIFFSDFSFFFILKAEQKQMKGLEKYHVLWTKNCSRF